MYLLVGLGNPGQEYATTRHNVGWIILHNLFTDSVWQNNKYSHSSELQEVIKGTAVRVIKPLTFMNESGKSIEHFIKKEAIPFDRVIVIYDDLDLTLGTVKISFDRGSGGHNGIKSIEKHLGSREFVRIRIGISKVLENGDVVKPNVLGNFEPSELKVVKDVSKKVQKVLETILTKGKEKAMTIFNDSSTDSYINV